MPTADEYLLVEPSAEVVILSAAGLIPAGCRVLDLGCGLGDDSVFLALTGCSCVGLDLSATKVAYAKRVAKEHRVAERALFLRADIRALPRGLSREHRGPFDFVLDRLACSNLASRTATKALFRAVAHLLVPRGIYCLVVGYEDDEGVTGTRVRPTEDFAFGSWFRPFGVQNCNGLPEVFGNHIAARPVLVGTYPAKLSNHTTARLYLLARKERRATSGTSQSSRASSTCARLRRRR